MAHLVRLILVALIAAFYQPVEAYGPTPGTFTNWYCYRNQSSTTGVGPNSTYPSRQSCIKDAAAACLVDVQKRVENQNAIVWNPKRTYSTGSQTMNTATQCGYSNTFTVATTPVQNYTDTGTFSYSTTTQSGYVCDAPLVSGVGGCFCPAGQKPVEGVCQPASCPSSGTQVADPDRIYAIPSLSSVVCYDGCIATGSMSAQYEDGPVIWGPLVSTGKQCNPASQGGSLPGALAPDSGGTGISAPAPCPAGQCTGEVNGVQVCKACSSVTTGVVTATDSGQASGGTITTTTCSNGVCTTNTTNVSGTGSTSGGSTSVGSGSGNPNAGTGSGTGDPGEEQTQDDFCQNNPQSPLCITSTWAGACSGFTCSGDAVQCAIAKEQHTRNCQLFDQDNELSTKGKAGMGGIAVPIGHPGAAASQVSLDFQSQLDQSDRLNGTCPGDRSISVPGGQTIVFPFSKVCEIAGWLSNLIVGLALFAAAWIVFRN